MKRQAGLLLLSVFVAAPLSLAEEVAHIPLDGSEQLVSKGILTFDKSQSSDGNGSVRLTATAPVSATIVKIPLKDVHNVILRYSAKLNSKRLAEPAYLEMWVGMPGRGEFFSKGLQNPVSATDGWEKREIRFLLRENEKPDYVKLNLVMGSPGTIWIDDIRIEKEAIQE